jgi:hypothetical protein
MTDRFKNSQCKANNSLLSQIPLIKNHRSLTSPTIPVEVGREDPMAFHLHKKLVCNESARLSAAIHGGFKETVEHKCSLPEEDPHMFGYFVEYMYREGWLHDKGTQLHSSQLLTLARLYTMGDRLLARDFQHRLLRKIAVALPTTKDLSDQDICDLLEITCTELPPVQNEDPLQAQILWCAASRLVRLQKFDRFPELLQQNSQLGVKLCMRAGNCPNAQPETATTPSHSRFSPETVFST